MVADIRFSKEENERTEAHEHLTHLSEGDLVIYDCGYLSFSLLTAHDRQGVQAIFRVSIGVNFNPIMQFWESQEMEAIVAIHPSAVTYRKTKHQHPGYALKPLRLRLIKYSIADETYVLATTVLDPKIPREEFIELYAERWRLEEAFKALKQTLELESFHAKSVNGVGQEVEAIALFWNLARILGGMAEPLIKKKRAICLFLSHYQINYRRCLIKVAHNIADFLATKGRKLARMITGLVRFLVRTSLPVRPDRHFPRRSFRPHKKWRPQSLK